ncbi:MAG TPA: hypothetical protein VL172_17595, partial [Kofleriaceae bacterium]|nr:hypothetical protein [Kofleriaceae bacterium]
EGRARQFADQFTADVLGDRPLLPYVTSCLQAARILLDAIARSDGTRLGIVDEMFKTQVTDDVLGSFTIGPDGDPVDASGPIIAFTFFQLMDPPGLQVLSSIEPMAATVDAALGSP